MTELTDVHTAVLWGCAGVALAVFALLIHSIATFRRPPGDAAQKRNATAEVFWTLVPIIIVVATAAPAVRSLVTPDSAAIETAHESAPVRGPELAGEVPQKAFHHGAIPL
jgi:heme/copper-type cytochrome/quinol oxidase subunit 2